MKLPYLHLGFGEYAYLRDVIGIFRDHSDSGIRCTVLTTKESRKSILRPETLFQRTGTVQKGRHLQEDR